MRRVLPFIFLTIYLAPVITTWFLYPATAYIGIGTFPGYGISFEYKKVFPQVRHMKILEVQAHRLINVYEAYFSGATVFVWRALLVLHHQCFFCRRLPRSTKSAQYRGLRRISQHFLFTFAHLHKKHLRIYVLPIRCHPRPKILSYMVLSYCCNMN